MTLSIIAEESDMDAASVQEKMDDDTLLIQASDEIPSNDPLTPVPELQDTVAHQQTVNGVEESISVYQIARPASADNAGLGFIFAKAPEQRGLYKSKSSDSGDQHIAAPGSDKPKAVAPFECRTSQVDDSDVARGLHRSHLALSTKEDAGFAVEHANLDDTMSFQQGQRSDSDVYPATAEIENAAATERQTERSETIHAATLAPHSASTASVADHNQDHALAGTLVRAPKMPTFPQYRTLRRPFVPPRSHMPLRRSSGDQDQKRKRSTTRHGTRTIAIAAQTNLVTHEEDPVEINILGPSPEAEAAEACGQLSPDQTEPRNNEIHEQAAEAAPVASMPEVEATEPADLLSMARAHDEASAVEDEQRMAEDRQPLTAFHISEPAAAPNLHAERSGQANQPQNDLRQTTSTTVHADQALSKGMAQRQKALNEISARQPILQVPVHRNGIVKVTKQRHPTKPRSVHIEPAIHPPSTPRSGDVLKILQWTLQQEQQSTMQAAAIRNEQQELEIAALKDAAVTERAKTEASIRETAGLNEQLQGTKRRLAAFSEKLIKLSSSVNELGVNMQSLQEQGTSFSQACKDFALEGATRDNERASLHEFFQECVGKSASLKDRVSAACREAKSGILIMEQARTRLIQQFDQKQQTLDEQTSKVADLEERLAKSNAAYDEIKQQLDRHVDSIVTKMASLHEAVAAAKDNQESDEKLKSLETTLKSLQARDTAAPADIERLESVIQSLSERVTSHFKTLATHDTEGTASEQALEFRLKQQFDSIRNELQCSHTLKMRLSDIDKINVALEQRCSAKDVTIVTLQDQVSMLQEKGTDLATKLASSEAEVSCLKATVDAHQETANRLRELEHLKSQLKQQLGRAQEEADIEASRTATLASAELALREQLTNLKEQLRIAEEKLAAMPLAPVAADYPSNQQSSESSARTVLDAKKFHTEKMAEFENKLHLEKQKRLKAEQSLSSSQTGIGQLKTQLLEQQQQLDAVRAANETEGALDEAVKSLTEQLNAKKREIEKLSCEFEGRERDTVQQSRTELESVEKKLEAETLKRTSLEADLGRLKTQAEAQLREEQDKAKRQIEQLHEQVTEMEAEKRCAIEQQQWAIKEAVQALTAAAEKQQGELREMQRRLKDAETQHHNVKRDLEGRLAGAKGDFETREAQLTHQLEAEMEHRVVAETALQRSKASSYVTPIERYAASSQEIKLSTSQDDEQTFKRPARRVSRQSDNFQTVSRPTASPLSPARILPSEEADQAQFNDLFTSIEQSNKQVPERNASIYKVSGQTIRAVAEADPSYLNREVNSSPLSEARSVSEAEGFKENQPSQGTCLPNGAAQEPRHGKRILRELTVNATTPVRYDASPLPANNVQIDSDSSLGLSQPVPGPFFHIFESPSVDKVQLAESNSVTVSRSQSNMASRMVPAPMHRTSKNLINGSHTSAAPTASQPTADELLLQRRTSQMSQPSQVRQSLIREEDGSVRTTLPTAEERHSSTPDYVHQQPQDHPRVTYGHHRSSSRPGSSNESNARRGSGANIRDIPQMKMSQTQPTIKISNSQREAASRKRSIPPELANDQAAPLARRQRISQRVPSTQSQSQSSQTLLPTQASIKNRRLRSNDKILPENQTQLKSSQANGGQPSRRMSQVESISPSKSPRKLSQQAPSQAAPYDSNCIPTFKEHRAKSQQQALSTMSVSSRARVGSSHGSTGKSPGSKGSSASKSKRVTNKNRYSDRFNQRY